MKKLEQILNEIKREEIKDSLICNEEDYFAGYINYSTYAKNRRILLHELNHLSNKEVKTC